MTIGIANFCIKRAELQIPLASNQSLITNHQLNPFASFASFAKVATVAHYFSYLSPSKNLSTSTSARTIPGPSLFYLKTLNLWNQ